MAEQLGEVVERARRGDSASFEALYDRFEPGVYGLCYHLLGDRDAAMDATQETFVNAWERIGRLRHVEAFSAWLRRAAINVCRHRRRKLGRLSWFSEHEPGGDPEETLASTGGPPDDLARGELSQQVREALGKLSTAHREVVVLHYYQGLELKDMAVTMGVAVGTVKSRLGRARDHLERLLTPYLTE